MKVLRENVRAGVRLSVGEDDKFVVEAGGEVLITTGVESLAEITYAEALEARDPARALRARERAHFEMQAMRSESFARRAANARKTGGKGGRGGV